MTSAIRSALGGLLALTLLCAGASAGAAEPAACRHERLQLATLRAEISRLEQQRAGLVNLGDASPYGRALADLLGADPADDTGTANVLDAPLPPGPWASLPEHPACSALQTEWDQVSEEGKWLLADIHKRQRHLLTLPAPARHALARTWRLQQQLLRQHAATNGAKAVLEQPLAMNRSLLTLLPRLAEPDEAAPALLALWQATLLSQAPGDEGAPGTAAERRLANLAAREVRHELDLLRRWLWREHPDAFRAGLAANRMRHIDLLTSELRASHLQLQWHWEGFRDDFLAAQEAPGPLMALTALLAGMIGGLLGFLGLVYLTRRSVAPLLAASSALGHKARHHRGLATLAGMLGALAPLLPWLLLGIGLGLLEALYAHFRQSLLLLMLPLARAYVVFGLARTAGEWLLLHLAQQAGVYLGTEQTQELTPRIRRFALALALVWLTLDLIRTEAGPSLLQTLAGLLALALAYFALGRLLAPRRPDVVAAMESILPPRLDPLAARLLGARLFPWLAPTLVPLLLVALALRFLHRLLLDFDGYRKLAARWFKLLSRQLEEKAGATGALPQRYSDWFHPTAAADLPHIDTGLVQALRRPLQRWLEAHTEENSLLLTGEHGIGKSSALAHLQASLLLDQPDLVLREARVPARTTTPDAVLALVAGLLELPAGTGLDEMVEGDAARAPTLVVLDDAEHLFLSRVGGLDGWRCMLDLINAPLENVFWLLSMDNHAWAYLDNVFGRDYPLRNVLRVKPWSQGELRSLILSRHYRTGFQLQYDASLLSSRGPEAGNVHNAEQRCFSLLWDASRGNPLLAMSLWLTSLRTAGNRISVSLPAEPPRLTGLDRTSTKNLFVFTAIALHGGLTLTELAAVTQLPSSGVRFALKSGLDAGFLMHGDNGRYCLQPLWQHALTSYLARKNLLHE